MLRYKLINDCAERRICLPQRGEEVLVLGMVMFVEQRRIGVEHLKKLVSGIVVAA